MEGGRPDVRATTSISHAFSILASSSTGASILVGVTSVLQVSTMPIRPPSYDWRGRRPSLPRRGDGPRSTVSSGCSTADGARTSCSASTAIATTPSSRVPWARTASTRTSRVCCSASREIRGPAGSGWPMRTSFIIRGRATSFSVAVVVQTCLPRADGNAPLPTCWKPAISTSARCMPMAIWPIIASRSDGQSLPAAHAGGRPPFSFIVPMGRTAGACSRPFGLTLRNGDCG